MFKLQVFSSSRVEHKCRPKQAWHIWRTELCCNSLYSNGICPSQVIGIKAVAYAVCTSEFIFSTQIKSIENVIINMQLSFSTLFHYNYLTTILWLQLITQLQLHHHTITVHALRDANKHLQAGMLMRPAGWRPKPGLNIISDHKIWSQISTTESTGPFKMVSSGGACLYSMMTMNYNPHPNQLKGCANIHHEYATNLLYILTHKHYKLAHAN